MAIGCEGGILLPLILNRKDQIDWDFLLLEICALLVFAAIIFYQESFSRTSFIFLCICYVLVTTERFYDSQEVTQIAYEFSNRSIAYDKDAQMKLDSYVDSFESKELYRYIGIEENNKVPSYAMNNFSWYGTQNHVLSNLLRYSLHAGAVTKEYKEDAGISYFNNFDWNYMHDIQADFIIVNQATIDENPELYNRIVDWNRPAENLNMGFFCLKLKHFLPRHYSDGELEKEVLTNILDNGYFYCPNLTNNDIKSFNTDGSRYFKITLNANKACEVQYSLAPMDQYKYYVDDKEYFPTIEYGLAYFDIPSGSHSIVIKYNDSFMSLINWIYYVYLFIITVCFIYLLWKRYAVSRKLTALLKV
jgi:hypothetical protein